MGAGCAFRSLVSEPGWRAETIAIHNKGFGPRAAAEQSPRHSPGGRGPPLGNDMPKGSSHCPILGQAHVWTPALWGSGAKGVRAREAPRPGCLPLCGSHLSNQSVAANCSAALSPPSMRSLHLPQPRHPGHLQRRAQIGPSDPRARATTRARVVPARILPDIPRPRAASSTPWRGEAEEAKPASRRGPSLSCCKARDGGPQSLDRPLQPGVPRLAPGLPRRSGHCSVKVRGKCGLPGPEQTRRGGRGAPG